MRSKSKRAEAARSVLPLLAGIAEYKAKAADPSTDEWDNWQEHLRIRVSRRMSQWFKFSSEGDEFWQLDKLNDSLVDRPQNETVAYRISIEDPFSETGKELVTCDEFITWGSEVAICRKGRRYAIYHTQFGLLTPFIFDTAHGSRHPYRIYAKFNNHWINVNFLKNRVIYNLGSLYFDNLRDLVAEAVTGKKHEALGATMKENPDRLIWEIWCAS